MQGEDDIGSRELSGRTRRHPPGGCACSNGDAKTWVDGMLYVQAERSEKRLRCVPPLFIEVMRDGGQ